MPVSSRFNSLQGSREVTPPEFRVWLQDQEDKVQTLEIRFQHWLAKISIAEDLFQKYVYENPDAGQSDFRQHRLGLYDLLAKGEELYIDFQGLGDQGGIQNFLNLIDQKIAELTQTLYAWHGPIEGATDLPVSFIQGVKELREGKATAMKF